jgi:hypothetical protein
MILPAKHGVKAGRSGADVLAMERSARHHTAAGTGIGHGGLLGPNSGW